MRISLLIFSFVGMFIFFFSKPPIIQNQDYHQFVDTRSFMGIPNAMDVLTNLCFLAVGLAGILESIKRKAMVTFRSWQWFFISILLIAPGSAFYHWAPTDSTLVWDRLPMSMGFMALYVILLSEFVSDRFIKILIPALVVGIFSVLVWWLTTDLRFYFWIQFSSFISIPVILLLFPSRFTHQYWYYISLGFYTLAKVAEVKDKEIFMATNEILSGHSLKHILAAVGLMGLAWMLRVRRVSDSTL